MLSRWSQVCFAIVLVSGCAAAGPPVTRVPSPAERMSFRGFSILPPQGEHWYIVQRDGSGVLFSKLLMDGSKRPIVGHTFGVLAMVVYPKEGAVTDLQAYVQSQMRSEGRVTPLQTRVTDDTTLGFECVRFENVSEQRDPPLASGAVLTLTVDGLYCRHPLSPRYLVQLSYSERHPQKQPSRLDDALRREAEGVLRSVAFVALPRAGLPPDARVIPPAPSVPRDRAALSGKWSGTLDDGVDHILLVEEVRMDDAVVVVSLGLLAGPGGERMKASFRDDALVMQTPGGITLTYRPQPDGTLSATISRRNQTLRAIMTRNAD
jgi:hypothetical protein